MQPTQNLSNEISIASQVMEKVKKSNPDTPGMQGNRVWGLFSFHRTVRNWCQWKGLVFLWP
jgi:hypothetical protein